MKYEWLDSYLLGKKGASRDFKAEWNATRYLLKDKMFCMIGEDGKGKPIITLKCEPAFGLLLREQYPDITPGYYMNKDHWNSVYADGLTPDDVVREMADMSYTLVLASLTKKARSEIQENL